MRLSWRRASINSRHPCCNKCGRAMPVRERLLLILPDGELYDYLCQGCGSSVGSKTERAPTNLSLVKPGL